MYSQLDPKITDEARNFGFKVKENCGVWKNMFIAPPHPSINNYKFWMSLLQAVKDDFVANFLKATLPEKRLRKGEIENLEYFKQNLDNKPIKKRKLKESKRKSLTSRERRKLKLFDIPKEGHK